MNGGGKSDGPIVPRKPVNNGGGNRLWRDKHCAAWQSAAEGFRQGTA